MEKDKSKKFKLSKIGTPKIILLGFLIANLMGACILSLPISSAKGTWTSFVDSLFTSTTSICVTGLTVVPTYSHWSTFGKVVILGLIQLGGLGVVCVAIGIFIVIGKRITMKERIVIQETYNMESMQGLVKLVKNVFKGTMLVEGIGAILYSFHFIPQFGVGKGILYSIFHAISCFCNAGIDLIGESSFVPFHSSILINGTTMFLIVMGGIGFTVWWDVARVIKQTNHSDLRRRQFFKRLTLHSKLAILVTAILIVSGAVLVLLLEYNNPATLGNMNWGDKVMASTFESVTTRTAGCYTVPQEGFRDTTALILIILMLIGGSPVGTAGGIKTTTIAMVLLSVRATIRGKKNTEVFGRRIGAQNIRTGLAVIVVSLLIFLMGIILLSITEDASILDITYEAASAIATVGLSRALSPNLTEIGKVIVILLMFIGRIGPITMVMAFNIKRTKAADNLRELPEKKIIVG